MNCKNKSFMTKRKAFTLIELLIVIAIIGILFIVLISKVDFATDKAKATGVQTDFRSFQVAIETVAKENAGLATFGWDTGDANGDRVRNSYDRGDTNKNGKQDPDEIFVGSKTYDEEWTNIYTLTNPADVNDKSAIAALEATINANLDPKLHITIHDDLTITMANSAQDPWNTEYHGYYITNAEVDNKDRGAIVIYSNGANQEFGSEHFISGGVVVVNVPGNNVYGKDDYSMAVIYTYVNGYGEVKTSTSGFGNNQATQGNISNNSGTEGTEDSDVTELLEPGLYNSGAIELAKTGDVEAAQDMIKTSWNDLLAAGIVHVTNGVVYSNLNFDTWENASSDALDGDLVLPNDGSITSIGDFVYDEDSGNYIGNVAFGCCYKLTGISIPDSVTIISENAFSDCSSLTSVTIGNGVTSIGYYAFAHCYSLTNITIPNNATEICMSAFYECTSLTSIVIPNGVTSIGDYAFAYCYKLTSITIPDSVTSIGNWAFCCCTSLTSVTIPNSVTSIGEDVFYECTSLTSVTIPDSVTSIGALAFYQCKGLTSITIGNGVTSIGERAFQHCTGLTSITIPDNVTSIGYEAFRDCTGLTSVTIGNGVTSIDYWAFSHCEGLTSITIPDSVTSISNGAFSVCTSLTSITIPNSVTSIGNAAFSACRGLTSIIYSGTKDQWYTISKDVSWNNYVPATYVQCTDGQVTF